MPMQSRQLLHKLAQYKYYDAHRDVANARPQMQRVQKQSESLNSALDNLGYWSSDAGLIAARQQQRAAQNRTAARILHLERHLSDCSKEKCKWQIMEQKLAEKVRKHKMHMIDEITEDMLQNRYQ